MVDKAVRTSDGFRGLLRAHRDKTPMSWAKYRYRSPWSFIPAGTLHAIYTGGPVPGKYHALLSIVDPVLTVPCWCGQVHTKPHPRPRKPARDLFAMSTADLRRALDNRRVMK